MALTTIISISATQGTNSLTNPVTFTVGEQINVNLTTSANITTSAANVGFALNFTATKLQFIAMSSDQPCTVYFNATSGGSPSNTFTLTATNGNGYVWYGQIANPVATNVTTGFVSANGTTSITNFNAWFGLTSP